MCASNQPLTPSIRSLPYSLGSRRALSGAKDPHLFRFLWFQPLGQQNVEGKTTLLVREGRPKGWLLIMWKLHH